jgi:hypothetical protein
MAAEGAAERKQINSFQDAGFPRAIFTVNEIDLQRRSQIDSFQIAQVLDKQAF